MAPRTAVIFAALRREIDRLLTKLIARDSDEAVDGLADGNGELAGEEGGLKVDQVLVKVLVHLITTEFEADEAVA